MTRRTVGVAMAALMMGLVAGCTASTPQSGPRAAPPPDATPTLSGTSWQLVRFAGADGARPDDPQRYTIAFGADGRVAVRADCNRGGGTWSQPATGQVALGPIATTRMGCPPGSQGDRFLRDLGSGGAYRISDGTLELASGPGGSGLLLQPAQP